MTDTPPDCPYCATPAARIERLTRGWRFCPCCSRTFLVEHGVVVSAPPKPAERQPR